MSLNTQMKALKHAVEAGALPSVVGTFGRAETALRQSGILERAIYAATKTGVLALVRTKAVNSRSRSLIHRAYKSDTYRPSNARTPSMSFPLATGGAGS
jgi:hypothetical protein